MKLLVEWHIVEQVWCKLQLQDTQSLYLDTPTPPLYMQVWNSDTWWLWDMHTVDRPAIVNSFR